MPTTQPTSPTYKSSSSTKLYNIIQSMKTSQTSSSPFTDYNFEVIIGDLKDPSYSPTSSTRKINRSAGNFCIVPDLCTENKSK